MGRAVPLFSMIAPCILYLEERGARIHVSLREPVRPKKIAAFEREFGLTLSPGLRDFYVNGSDGLFVSWSMPDSDDFGQIPIPDLEDLRILRQNWVNTDRHPDNLNLEHADDPSLGRQTWESMQFWIPLWDEGNGDRVCVDTATDAVVLHQHDWNDAGTGQNGVVLETDLITFIDRWAGNCFVGPSSLSWNNVAAGGTVNWFSEEFPSEYRLQ